MDPDKSEPGNLEEQANQPNTSLETSEDASQTAPADALSRSPDELEDEAKRAASEQPAMATTETVKPPSKLKRFFKRANLYFLFFLILVVIAAIIATVSYLNSQKAAPEPSIASQELTEEALQQLSNTDASVGGASQTLTIKGNAIIEGQSLLRGNLNVANNFQSGGSIQGPSLTISGDSNLGEAQVNSLQVASNVAIEGDTSMRNLNVSGASSFSGAITASQITVSRLVMSGNAS